MKSLWRRLLGVEDAVIKGLEFDDGAGGVGAKGGPARRDRQRCGRCLRRAGWYDAGEGRRRWRGLDLGTLPVYLEAEAPRVNCREHGVTVTAVPWARHDSRFTQAFEDQAAWLVTHTSRTAVSELMRVAWRSVGGIITRVV